MGLSAPVAAQDAATHNRRGVELSTQGRYQEAIAEFEKALKLAPNQTVLRRNLAHAHGNLATLLLRERAFREAAAQYEKAIDLLPEEAGFYLGFGAAALGLQEMNRAVDALRRARDLKPGEVEVYRLLGEVYYRQGDSTQALATWEEGLRLRPADSNLQQLIAQLKREQRVEEGYHRRLGHHFTLRYVGGVQEEVGREILRLLERAYDEVGYDLNHYPQTEIEVVLYSDADFQMVTNLPVWVAGAHDERAGKIRIPIRGLKRVADLQHLLYHEYTHVVVRDLTGGRVPTWLNEGLALIEQRTPMEGASELVRQLAAERRLPSLGALSGSFVQLSGEQARVAYAVSYAATKYLVDRWSLWDVQRLLRRLGEGAPFEAALEEATRLTLPDFEREWRQSLHRGY
jgi:tetratricopeptide (TPR) repeat protein